MMVFDVVTDYCIDVDSMINKFNSMIIWKIRTASKEQHKAPAHFRPAAMFGVY